ncbi:MAG: cell division protein SepF [Clostridia bacterium]|nr:cell division protein SepF [Clostridia bacterium]
MSIFDFWNKKENNEQGVGFDVSDRAVVDNPSKNGPLYDCRPKGYGDVEVIIDNLKKGNQVLLHVEELKPSTAIRVLDLLSGAIYALNGGITEVQKDVFLLTPSGIQHA